MGLLEVRKAKEGKGRERRGEGHHPFCLVSVSMVRQKKDPKKCHDGPQRENERRN